MSFKYLKLTLFLLALNNKIFCAEQSITHEDEEWVNALLIADSEPKTKGIKRKSCDKSDKENIPPLKKAKMNPLVQALNNDEDNYLENLKKILSAPNADINRCDDMGRTALYWAAQENKLDALKFLLKFDEIEIDKADVDGFTPLLIAVQQENIEVVKILLGRGEVEIDEIADIDHKDKLGFTPVMRAILSKNYILTKLLLRNNADITKKTVIKNKEMLPLDLARHLKLKKMVSLIREYQEIWAEETQKFCDAMRQDKFDEALKILEGGIDINRELTPYKIPDSPLFAAADKLNIPMIDKLLKMGVNKDRLFYHEDEPVFGNMLLKYRESNLKLNLDHIIKQFINLDFDSSFCTEEALILFKEGKINSESFRSIIFNDQYYDSITPTDEDLKILQDHGINLNP